GSDPVSGEVGIAGYVCTPESIGQLRGCRTHLRRSRIDVHNLTSGRRMQDLEVHDDLFGCLDLGHVIERASPALDDQHPGHSAHNVEANGAMLVGMVPEGAGMVAGRDIDGHLVGGSGLHSSKYIVRVAEWGDFQAMSVEIDRVRRVWEGSCPGDRGIRGKVVDHADVQRVTWIEDQRRPGNRPLKGGAFDDVNISGRRVQDTIAGNLGVKTGVQLSMRRDAHLRLRETVGTRSRAAGVAGVAAATAQRAEDSNSYQ